MRRTLPFVLITLANLSNAATAQNTGFLPGDAFFHAVVTERSVDEMSAAEEAVLDYVRPESEEGSFSGYAGYWKLRLPTDSQATVRNLQRVYRDIRIRVPKEMREYKSASGTSSPRAASEIIETNGLHVFVYNADFDSHRYSLGLRYNESWLEDTASFGPNPKWVRLELFVDDRGAFSDDWRDASKVPKLDVTCPAIPDQARRMELGIGNARIDVPLEVRNPVQLIVLPTRRLGPYFRKRNGAYFFSISSESVKIHRMVKGEWTSSDWPHSDEDR